MKKLNFLVSLTNNENDYQVEQEVAAEETAQKLGVAVRIVHAGNDAILQSQHILQAIQSRSEERPHGIIFEPVGGTAMSQVARAAAAAGIGWAVLNRDAEYIPELRKVHHAPVFTVSSDHEEIGRIQGRQIAALLPKGGEGLYITGPSESSAAKERTTGMYETKPVAMQLRVIKSNWTEGGAYKAVSSWLRLSISFQTPIAVVAAQDDSMAVGVRKAFEDLPPSATRDRWLKLPFLGCDGLPKSGQAFVKRGTLAATVLVPPNTGLAIELLTKAIRSGTLPPERTMTVPVSIPTVEALAKAQTERARVFSAGNSL